MSIGKFRPTQDRHRSIAEWRAKLKSARDEREVLLVVREFVSSLTHFEWALLGMQPDVSNMESATGLAAFSYEIMRVPQAREPNAEEVVSTITAFFSDAVARIAHLGNPRNADKTA